MKLRFLAIVALALASCGNRSQTPAPAAAPAADLVRNVEVVTALERDVDQESTYSSTVQPFATNNIQPQQGGRIRRILVEVGDYLLHHAA